MIDPKNVCLFQPSELKKFKAELFQRIGSKIVAQGGQVIVGNVSQLKALPKSVIPIVGCSSYLKGTVDEWREKRRPFGYWDRGYARRVFATWLPRGDNGGYYRWHLNSFQSQKVRDVPDDRWRSLGVDVRPWQRNGKHIVIAAPTRTYAKFHGCENWIADTIDALARATDRQLVIRDKESKRSLQSDLDGAHCLVSHGSIAAVESIILGCPVVVHHSSAAALVGLTDMSKVETPVYPDRQPWLNSLAYNQFNENELVDGTLWSLLE
jgi:hypothetical protein